ncbi:NlpC/P60 family protein [Streptomyces peucetius]|uniref:NlpC/P60 family protein n=1 Tax=Streptomyces peucetius TaxID=1950 RepID=A0ABY6I4A3_STRPE|nr:C40 family peptidase [Streptomyces peucetius]UYQ61671.1 NlpC/P60 family protein [Streptomyces peucetius]
MVSHRRSSQPGLTRGARGTVLSAAAATAAAALGAGAAPAGAEPGTGPEATRAMVDRLYEEAERATERFNKAGERVEHLKDEVAHAQDRVARSQERINRMREALGSVAGAQYRSGGIDPALALLLSEDPDGYLEAAATLDRISERHSAALDDLHREQRHLGQERAEASRDLAELERSRQAVADNKRTVERKLGEARRLLNTLPAGERDPHDRSSRSGRDAFPDLSGLSAGSPHAAAATMAARSVVGRPYVWGANGPSGFDCSGLVQWSYAQAGVGLPRTSQAQANAGRRVPLSQARPGDIVTYRGDASHVGMYVGNGQVVHAPYPGASVRYDPVGMMPVHAVTRV